MCDMTPDAHLVRLHSLTPCVCVCMCGEERHKIIELWDQLSCVYMFV